MAHKEDAKDPVIPQLVWIAYEKILSKASRERKRPEEVQPPSEGQNTGRLRSRLAGTRTRLARRAHAATMPFVRDQIVPKVMRRLVATGEADDLRLCVDFVAKLKDAASREKALEGLADRAGRAIGRCARGLGRPPGRDR